MIEYQKKEKLYLCLHNDYLGKDFTSNIHLKPKSKMSTLIYMKGYMKK